MADLMSAGPNGPCPYPGELSVTVSSSVKEVAMLVWANKFTSTPTLC